MKVSKITADGDWSFGKGRANYATNTDAVRQNVVTRIRSFTNDWYADINHGINWFGLLGSKSNEQSILRAIEKIVLETPGVSTITVLRILGVDKNRPATIELNFTTLFQQSVALQETVGI